MVDISLIAAALLGLSMSIYGQETVSVNNSNHVTYVVHEEQVSWMLAISTCDDNISSYAYSWTDELHFKHLSQAIVGASKLPTLKLLWYGALRPLGLESWFSSDTCSEVNTGISVSDETLDMCAAINVSSPSFSLVAFPCNGSLPFVCINESIPADGQCTMVSFPSMKVDTTTASADGLIVTSTGQVQAACETGCRGDSTCISTTVNSSTCVKVSFPGPETSASIYLTTSPVGTATSAVRTCNDVQFIPTGTIDLSASTVQLSCPATNLCYCYDGQPLSNETVTTIAQLFGTLVLIDQEDTLQYKRKFSSADDRRPSAKAVGSFAIIFIMSVFILLSIPDVIELIQFLHKKYTRHVNRARALEQQKNNSPDTENQSGEGAAASATAGNTPPVASNNTTNTTISSTVHDPGATQVVA